ncbi:gamma-glutamyl-gamma-aminobutyrate hydrolase family protein [Microbacterium sp. NPDC089696]|uniref:gamma-glutamyl-gamma-aminobutyrate hydrolase family protein n=1 Tax=Microbacterium sp. NPDC089696 TaxID=3364199 RepID=UPI0037F2D37B
MSIHAALFHVRTRRPRAGAEYQRLLDALNASAVAAVEDMGWTASLHAAGSDPEHSLRRASREADVVVLLGGDDIDPSLYGQSDRRPIRTPYERRADRMQIAVIMDAVSQRRPLLGVCRGHQLLNVALGGTLRQHVPGHRGAGANPFVDTAVPGIATLAPGLQPPALCTHHQAVDELGRGLHAVLHSDDGVIEAITHESLPFLGVQWHPEHPASARAQLTGLLRAVHRRGAARETQLARVSSRRA